MTATEMAGPYLEAERWLGCVEHPVPDVFSTLQDCGGYLTGRAGADNQTSQWSRALKDAHRLVRERTIALQLLVEGDHVYGLEVHTTHGLERILADQFVLAASPVETCRLLLQSGASHPEIGRNFTDHITTLCYAFAQPGGANVSRADARGALLRFPAGSLATFDQGFAIEVFGPTSLDAATARVLSERGSTACEGMTYTAIGAIGEQFPITGRSVLLNRTRKDRIGRLVPHFNLSVGEQDLLVLDEMRAMCTEVATRLGGIEIVEVQNSLEQPHVFHPGGVARMGSGEDAPVDEFGRLREWPNVWIADASVFPTSGDVHPTLTVIAHVYRLVHRLLVRR
jgi:hypothetical protein